MEWGRRAFIAGLLAGVIYFVPFAAIGFLQDHRPGWLSSRFLSLERYTSAVMWVSLGYTAACIQYNAGPGLTPPAVAMLLLALSFLYKLNVLR